MIVVCSPSTLDMLVGSVCSRSFHSSSENFYNIFFLHIVSFREYVSSIRSRSSFLIILHLLPIAAYALVISVCTNKLTYRVDKVFFDFLVEGLHEFSHLEQLHIVILDTALNEWALGALLEFIFLTNFKNESLDKLCYFDDKNQRAKISCKWTFKTVPNICNSYGIELMLTSKPKQENQVRPFYELKTIVKKKLVTQSL
jgi:hypothetical protein